MSADLIVFLVLSLIAIASALGMLFSRNAVYSALFLVLNFVTVAVFYLLLGAPFIAMSQITVYAGAIMVLFLFVIMLLGADSLAPTNSLPWQKPLAGLLSVVLVVESIYLIMSRAQAGAPQWMPAGSFAALARSTMNLIASITFGVVGSAPGWKPSERPRSDGPT